MNGLYKQEVLELTELLSNDEYWANLRDILIEKGFNIRKIALVSFMEDDEENEYGVIVTKRIKISEYSRSTQNGKNNVNNFRIKDITNEKDKIYKYAQISVAIDMV